MNIKSTSHESAAPATRTSNGWMWGTLLGLAVSIILLVVLGITMFGTQPLAPMPGLNEPALKKRLDRIDGQIVALQKQEKRLHEMREKERRSAMDSEAAKDRVNFYNELIEGITVRLRDLQEDRIYYYDAWIKSAQPHNQGPPIQGAMIRTDRNVGATQTARA